VAAPEASVPGCVSLSQCAWLVVSPQSQGAAAGRGARRRTPHCGFEPLCRSEAAQTRGWLLRSAERARPVELPSQPVVWDGTSVGPGSHSRACHPWLHSLRHGLLALLSLQSLGIAHPRCVLLLPAATGVYTGEFTPIALCGFVRAMGEADGNLDRIWVKAFEASKADGVEI